VSSSIAQLGDDFERLFCQTLVENLSRDLGAMFRSTRQPDWPGDGKTVTVDVRVASKSRAEVTTSYGEVSEGTFTPGSSASSSLGAIDAPLTPASSRALVRGIALQMGLVR
jgi:hypothetical protein